MVRSRRRGGRRHKVRNLKRICIARAGGPRGGLRAFVGVNDDICATLRGVDGVPDVHSQLSSCVMEDLGSSDCLTSCSGAAAPSSAEDGVVAASCAQAARGSERMTVEALMSGDGSVDSSGLCALAGGFYGSPQALAPHAMFAAMELDDELFEGFPEAKVQLRTYAVSGTAVAKRRVAVPLCTVPETPLTRLWRATTRSKYVRAYVSGWLRLRPGVAVIIGRVGARAASSELRALYCVGTDAVWNSYSQYGCLGGALLNGAFALAGEDAAAAVKLVVDEQ
eukprot:IDg21617t1